MTTISVGNKKNVYDNFYKNLPQIHTPNSTEKDNVLGSGTWFIPFKMTMTRTTRNVLRSLGPPPDPTDHTHSPALSRSHKKINKLKESQFPRLVNKPGKRTEITKQQIKLIKIKRI
ncbi:hypothetical protein Pcinc_002846 [Petrolisthes cinctipes]|uniref:Uncharacterized protein n=1 Tax=Petrolisthes cinctipes TaxID=88211 RepID=A0AAE1L547_PETCI|nr:hypothetical protein Pcinc_002846 [Petrolisthes cinctipes]